MNQPVTAPVRQCSACGVLTHDLSGHYTRCQARGLSLFDRLIHTNPFVRQAAAASLKVQPRRDKAPAPSRSRDGAAWHQHDPAKYQS
jgi:hypothetical protein